MNTTELEEVAAAHNVSALPTFQLFSNGSKVGEYVGADLAALKAEIAKRV